MKTTTVRIGTRASVLATTQSELVAAMVRERLGLETELVAITTCLLYTSPSPRDGLLSRMPSSA